MKTTNKKIKKGRDKIDGKEGVCVWGGGGWGGFYFGFYYTPLTTKEDF